MTNRLALIGLALIVMALPVVVSSAADQPAGANLLKNPGFEQGSKSWSIDPAKWQVVSDAACSGKQCLRISNDDKASYSLVSQAVPCLPGRRYHMKVRIKTENVQGTDSGATICLEWADKRGQYLGGSYPVGLKGTNDWTLLEADSKTIPPDASSLRAIVYLRRECTGTAWFDDVGVELTDLPGQVVFRPMLRYPNYRETIFPWQSHRLDVGAMVSGNQVHPVENMALRVSVLDSANKAIAGGEETHMAGKPWAGVQVDLAGAKPGAYRAVVSLRDTRAGSDIAYQVLRFRIADESAPRPAVYIDEQNRCIVNGEPYFPLGMYMSEAPASPVALEDLKRFSESRFNCLMMYGINNGTPDQIRTYLDTVNRYGRKIIYSVKDIYAGSTWEVKSVGEWTGVEQVLNGVVSEFKDHPALLAWYLNDELSGERLPEIADHYAKVRTIDPNHPIWQVLYLGQKTADHVSSTDVLGIDNYPVPAAPITNFYVATEDVRQAVMGARAIWMVPQGASQGAYSGHPEVRQPTFEETMCMSYLGLIHGARGLIYYSFFDLKRTNGGDTHWEVLKKVSEEMQRIKPIVLGIDAPEGKRVSVNDDRIHVLTREVDGELFVLAANPYKESVKATFRIGSDARVTRVEATAPARVTGISRNSFSDAIEPYGVRVYKLATR